jgi:hypothetical protein
LVGQLADEAPDRQWLLTSLMEANFNWRGTAGGTLAMDYHRNVHLQRRWLLPLPEPDLPGDLGRLVHLAETWRTKLTSSASDVPADSLRI